MRWYMDKGYMKNHILTYVKFQLGQGYHLQDIKSALLKCGYDTGLIDDICSGINPKEYKPVKQALGSLKNLDEELYLYLQNLLVDYIKKEQSQGYTLEVIERALINYGHHPSMVKKALKTAKHGVVTDFHELDRLKLPSSLLLAFSIAVILAVVFFLAMMTSAALYVVISSFIPSLVAVLFVYAIVINTTKKRLVQLLPVAAIAVAVAVFVAMTQASVIMRRLSDPQTILLINVCMAFVLGSIISFFSKKPHKKITIQDIVAGDDAVASQPKKPAAEEQSKSNISSQQLHKKNSPRKKRLKIKDF